MATIFVKHRVADYERWKRGYDEVDWLRKQYGITAASIHRDVSDPNVVLVVHQFKDLDSAQAFVGSEELRLQWRRTACRERRRSGSAKTSSIPSTGSAMILPGAEV